MRNHSIIALVVAMTGAVGCNYSPQVNAPSKDAGAPGETPEQAEAQFDDAEQTLRGLIASSKNDEDGGDAGARVTVTDDKPADDDRGGPMAQQNKKERKGKRCSRACRALASMVRSADRLCELTGSDDSRCQSVNVRVTSARQLVTNGCPACTT